MTDDAALAAHYRLLAHDAYAAAQLIQDPSECLLMHQIALGYQQLAANAEERERLARLAMLFHQPNDQDGNKGNAAEAVHQHPPQV